MTLGEVLDGDRMAVALYNISFKSSFELKTLCTNDLDGEDVTRIRHAIEDLYYFEFVFGKEVKVWDLRYMTPSLF